MSAKEATTHQIYWVASYPRSGNTFTRMLLARIYFNLDRTFGKIGRVIPEDITGSPLDASVLETRFGPTIFMKTHLDRPPVGYGPTAGALYLHRHPLDVFLSSMNYLFINNVHWSFRNDKAKSVDEIVKDGELDHYFQRFLEIDGFDHFMSFSGHWSESVRQWRELARQQPDRFMVLRYEDLTTDTLGAMSRIADHIGAPVDPDHLRACIQNTGQEIEGESRTSPEQGGAGAFFWKRQSGYHQSYLSPAQIAQFENKHGELLRALGY